MKIAFWVGTLIASLTLSCSSTAAADRPRILDKNLSHAYKNFKKSFGMKRHPLLFERGHYASSCATYFAMAAKYRLDESINNQLAKSEYLVCDALKILSNSSPVPRGSPGLSQPGEQILSRLDLRSFPSSLRIASDDKSHTLASLFPGRASADGNIAKIDTKDFALTLEVVATARVNDHATEDWIAWLFDESKSGNYRGYQTLIIYDPAVQADLKAAPYP